MKSITRSAELFAVMFGVLSCGMLSSTAAAQSTPPITFNVPTDAPTIQAAINLARDGDTVLVSPGTYYENIDFLGKDITVTTSGGASVTTLDGSHGHAPAVTMAPENATHSSPTPPPMVFSGFTVQGGGVEPSSAPTGGIFVSEGGPQILNNIITHNHCAGIYLSYSQPVIQGNEIDNTLDNGGDCGGTASGDGSAIYWTNYPFNGSVNNVPIISIIGNTIQNNVQAGQETSSVLIGSAMTLPDFAVIQNNIVSGNKTAGAGGAIAVGGGAKVLQNLINGNVASCASAISLSTGATSYPAEIIGNTIYGNTATGPNCAASQVSFDQAANTANNIIVGNTPQPLVGCGAMSSMPGAAFDPRLLIYDHNLFFNNGGATFDSSCVDPTGEYGNVNAAPQFVSAATGNFQLQVTSPAVDAGNVSGQFFENDGSVPVNTSLDLAGSPRVVDATGRGYAIIDIGAYEVQTGVVGGSPGGGGLGGNFELEESAVVLSASSTALHGGDTLTLTAFIFPESGPATGPVTFTEDGSTVVGTANVNSNYDATVSFPVKVGVHTFVANYAGQGSYAPGVSLPVSVLVTDSNSQSTLSVAPNPAAFGQTVSLTTTVVSAGTASATPTGTVTFFSSGTQLGSPVTLSNGIATMTVSTLAVGTNALTCSYSGDAVFNASQCAAVNESITPDMTSITLLAVPNPANQGQGITLPATIANLSSSASPVGTVTYTEGTTQLAQSNVTVAQGEVSATVVLYTLSPGTHNIVATYTPAAGNPDFTGSVSQPLAVTVIRADLMVTFAPPTLTIQTEHHATVGVTLASLGGLSGTISLSCGSLPQYATCTWTQSSITLPENGSNSTQLTIDTDAVLGFKSDNRGYHYGRSTSGVVLALLLPLCGFIGVRRRNLRGLLLAVLLTCGLLAGVGCGDKNPGHTAQGTYAITVTGTGGSVPQNKSTTLMLVVTP